MNRRVVKSGPLPDRRQLRYGTVAEGEPLRPRTGKSGRPDEYTKCGILLRHETKDAAIRRLRDERAGEDFSDLIERLLQQWLADGAIKETPVAPS